MKAANIDIQIRTTENPEFHYLIILDTSCNKILAKGENFHISQNARISYEGLIFIQIQDKIFIEWNNLVTFVKGEEDKKLLEPIIEEV